MGSLLTKNELSKLSTTQLVEVLHKVEDGKLCKYAQKVIENEVNGVTLVSLYSEREIDMFLIDMEVYEYKDRKRVLELLQCCVRGDDSTIALDSNALQLLPTIADLRAGGESVKSLKAKGYQAMELIEGGYPLKEVIACGYTSLEMSEAGYVTDVPMKACINGEELDGVYCGICRDGIVVGEGVCKYSNGDEYFGFWKNNMRNGEGTETKSNGNVYEGAWVDNNKEGFGVETIYCDETDKNGCKNATGTFAGEFRMNKKHGYGKFTSMKGFVYEGQYKYNKKHGHGVCCYANGDKYTGSFRNDEKSGEGELQYKDGTVYTGRFLMDKRWGEGKLRGDYGLMYDGSFRANMMHGFGRMFYMNGDIYEGNFVRGTKNGYGKYMWADGDIYEGCYYNDKRHDEKAKMHLKDGSCFEGVFRRDVTISLSRSERSLLGS